MYYNDEQTPMSQIIFKNMRQKTLLYLFFSLNGEISITTYIIDIGNIGMRCKHYPVFSNEHQ